VGRRRRSLKLAPLGRPKTTASAAQAPPAPPSGGSKRPPSPGGRPPPRQPGHSSTAACASVGRHVSQSKTAQWGLFSQSARVGSPRAQQHGGVRFYIVPRQQPEHSSTSACACAERPWRHVNSHGATARRRALLQERPWQPGHSSTAACASVGRHVSQSNTARRRLLPQSACLVSPRAQQHGGVCFHRARASSARARAQQHSGVRFCTWRHVNSQSTAAQ